MRSVLDHLLLLLPVWAVLVGLYVFKNAMLAIGLYHVLMVIVLIFARAVPVVRRLPCGWSSRMGPWLIAAGCCAGVVMYVLRGTILKACPTTAQFLAYLGLWDGNWLRFAVYFSIVNPLLETLFWTGHLSSKKLASLWDDVVFAVYHVLVLAFFFNTLWLFAAFVVLVVASRVWKAVYRAHGGLLVPLLSHAAADASIVIAVSLIRRGM